MKTVENNNQSQDEKNEGFWKEGKYIDAWSIVHFISGLLLGFILNALGFSIFEGFLIAAFLVILWEIIEPFIWKGWHETWQNRVVDIIIGLIGYLVAKFIDSFIDFLVTGKTYLDFSLATPEISSVIKLLLMLIGFTSILFQVRKTIAKFKEGEAKKQLNDFLEGLKKKIDSSELPEEQKKELKEKIDEAKKLIATCKSDDLKKAIDILRGIRDNLEKEGEETKKKIKDIITDLGIAETFATLIRIKSNWEGAIMPGVRDVKVVCEGKGENEKCYILIEMSPGAKKRGYQDIRIEIKKDKCKEAKEFVARLAKKAKECKYPNLDDAKKIWEFIDP